MTWKLNPEDRPLAAFVREFIRRYNIDTNSRRGQARVRAVMALIEALALDTPEPLLPHFKALEDGDEERVFALVEDWQASLQRMVNERRPPSRR